MKCVDRYRLARRARAKYAIAETHTPDDVLDVCEAVHQIETSLRRELDDIKTQLANMRIVLNRLDGRAPNGVKLESDKSAGFDPE